MLLYLALKNRTKKMYFCKKDNGRDRNLKQHLKKENSVRCLWYNKKYIFGLCPRFLAYSSWNLWHLWSGICLWYANEMSGPRGLVSRKTKACFEVWNLPMNPKWWGSESFWVAEHIEVLGGWHAQRGHGSYLPPPHIMPYSSLP